MELLTASKTERLTASNSSNKNPIPVMGIESSEDSLSAFMTEPSGESLNEYSEEHFYRTAELAYYRAEARGFEPGHEMEDWLAAESEVNQ